MILIADSGSTKTDWRLIDEKKNILQFHTAGFNPYFQGTNDISKELKENLVPSIYAVESFSNSVKDLEVYFYGAGCSSPAKCQTVKSAIEENFKGAEVTIHHDLLAAARAVCGHNEGIAAILGTGSNSCYYDGKEVVENVFSLGYFLGDEGSGAHIGKTFLKAYLYNELPPNIAANFNERYHLTKEEILDSIYKKPMPSRYLASFSKFVYQNLKEQYFIDMVSDCFREFFDRHILKYSKHKEVPMSCVGSVGFYYSNILRAIAQEKGVRMDKIIETPIAGLTLYHLEDR